jgi:protein involved in polysaccharide export with SLBB domain
MRRILSAAGLLTVLASVSHAQDNTPRLLATRAELQQALDTMPRGERTGIVGRAIESRLQNGDFLPGDRLQISVIGDTTLSGTFIVRPDGTIVLPNIEPINMRGVLRSEVEPFLVKEFSKYLRDPRVTARALIRLSVAGEVVRPGFYDLAPESAGSEITIAAGGLSAAADPQRIVVRRQGAVLYDKLQVRDFFVRSSSLDQMGLQTGDEFSVGRRSGTNVLPIIGAVTGIAFAVAAFATLF